jgi:hypothetical protein
VRECAQENNAIKRIMSESRTSMHTFAIAPELGTAQQNEFFNSRSGMTCPTSASVDRYIAVTVD